MLNVACHSQDLELTPGLYFMCAALSTTGGSSSICVSLQATTAVIQMIAHQIMMTEVMKTRADVAAGRFGL